MAKIKLRRDIEQNWTNANPILALGEPGFETDTNKLKIGDGSTAWTALDYVTSSSGGLDPYLTVVDGELAVTTTMNFVPSDVPGVITTVENPSDTVRFYQATGDSDGNMYTIGRCWQDSNYAFVYAFGPDGSVLWKQSITFGDQSDTGYLNGLKVKGNYVYVGGTYYNGTTDSHFVVTLNKADGTYDSDKVFRTPDNTYPRVIDIDVDSNGNMLVAGHYGNDTALLANVPVQGSGNHWAYFNNSDLNGYPSQSGYGGQWKIEVSEGVYSDCEINHAIASPQDLTTLEASGMIAAFRYDQNQNTYWGGYVVESGSGYNQGDSMRVPGSQLRGIDGGTTITATPGASNTNGGSGVVSLWFDKTTNPDLFAKLVDCEWQASYTGGGGPYQVNSVTESGNNWQVDISSTDPLNGDVSFYTVNGNDALWNYNGGQLSNLHGRPSQALQATTWLFNNSAPDYTGVTNINLKTSLSSQAVIWSPNWMKSFGIPENSETFNDVSYDQSSDSVYLAGDFWRYDNVTDTNYRGAVIKLSNADGSTIWAKYIQDNTGASYVTSVLPDISGSLYVVGKNNNGYTLVTKLNGLGDVVWQSRQTNNNNWNNEPRGSLDSSGNVYITGSWYNGNTYVTSIIKINGSDGTLVYSRQFYNNEQYDMYEFDNEDNQHTTVAGNNLFWAGYCYDANDNYEIGVAIRCPIDGSITGQFGRWHIDNDTDTAWEDCTSSANISTVTYPALVPSATTVDTGMASANTNTGSSTQEYHVALGGTTAGLTGVSSIAFNDGTTLESAGVAKHSTNAGDNNVTLALEHNAKFLHYYGSNGNSWIYVPSNSDVALPVGYTVTIVIDDFNSNYVYINNNTGPGDATINAVGFNPGETNYWRINNNGQIGVYTLMKVDTDRWVLAGPDIQVD